MEGYRRRCNEQAADLAWTLSVLPGLVAAGVGIGIGIAFEKDEFKARDALNLAFRLVDAADLLELVPGYDRSVEPEEE